MEDELNDIVQLVGKDSLSEDQKVYLEIAKVIKDDFLAQNAFSDYDYYCPLHKTIGIMKCIVTFFNSSLKAIEESTSDAKVTWALIYNTLKDEYHALSMLKMELPDQPKEQLLKKFDTLIEAMQKKFRTFSK